MADTDLYHWLALRCVGGIGNVTYVNLVRHFGTPELVFQAAPDALMQVDGVTAKTAAAIAGFAAHDEFRRELERVAALGISIVTVASSEYPELLRQVYDPPPFLYVKGKLHHDDRNAVAIVGSRNASEYGLRVAESLSRDLVRCGLTVVSGLARGIDARAHAAALSGGGRTIAVLGCGVDVVYPPELKRLYAAIAEQGALVSEYAPGTRPLSYHFPARNRIISGMCRGVAVVEASPKSGSLITARLAAEQGREVFAVPGNVYSYKTRGTHMLLKSGAKLVDDVRDIVEELRLPVIVDAAVDMNLGADEQSVFSSIDGDPVHVDEILERSGLAAGRLAAVLLELELNGLIKQMPGKRYVKA